MAVSQVSIAQPADAMSPMLIAPKMEAVEPKAPSQKHAKKGSSPEMVSAEASAVPTAPKSKKRAVSKGPEEGPACSGAAEETVEGEKQIGEQPGALIVAKAVRTLLKNHTTPIHLGSDALPALNVKVTELIYEAIGRSLANGRKTLKNSDF